MSNDYEQADDHLLPGHELAIHEWLALITILSSLLFISILSYFDKPNTSDGAPHYLRSPVVEVRIEGAVENPGSYTFAIGTKILDAIKRASPLPSADLRRFRSNSKIRSGQLIVVASRKMIEVNVRGAISAEGPLLVPAGSLLSELPKFIPLSDAADADFFTRERRLRNGETLYVPSAPPNIEDWKTIPLQ